MYRITKDPIYREWGWKFFEVLDFLFIFILVLLHYLFRPSRPLKPSMVTREFATRDGAPRTLSLTMNSRASSWRRRSNTFTYSFPRTMSSLWINLSLIQKHTRWRSLPHDNARYCWAMDLLENAFIRLNITMFYKWETKYKQPVTDYPYFFFFPWRHSCGESCALPPKSQLS